MDNIKSLINKKLANFILYEFFIAKSDNSIQISRVRQRLLLRFILDTMQKGKLGIRESWQ